MAHLTDYVHGYDTHENTRLQHQAATLVDLLHSDTAYPPGSVILEAGCGVGAQTVTLAQRSPGARFMSVDISAASVAEARRRTAAAGITNVEFQRADIFDSPFDPESFDHGMTGLSSSSRSPRPRICSQVRPRQAGCWAGFQVLPASSTRRRCPASRRFKRRWPACWPRTHASSPRLRSILWRG